MLGSQLLYRLLSIVGAVMLFDYRHWGAAPLWSLGDAGGWALVGLAILGFLFCWWARLHLGRLWSSSVTRKADHHIVDTGPYGLVRHPIYSGVIFAAAMTACLRASPTSLLGLVLFATGFSMTAAIEERFLRQQLSAEAYDAYSRRVPMLVPFVR